MTGPPPRAGGNSCRFDVPRDGARVIPLVKGYLQGVEGASQQDRGGEGGPQEQANAVGRS
jgi:hypothetical protein